VAATVSVLAPVHHHPDGAAAQHHPPGREEGEPSPEKKEDLTQKLSCSLYCMYGGIKDPV
jgi:hypothetical protein